jgi:hypothetical protein
VSGLRHPHDGTAYHDGQDNPPLPAPELPKEDTPVTLVRPVDATTVDGTVRVTLPPGTPCTFKGVLDEPEVEVSAALIVHAACTPADFRAHDNGEEGR